VARDSGLVMPGRPPRRDATVAVAWVALAVALVALFLGLRSGGRAGTGGDGEADDADAMEDLATPAALENRVTDLELRLEKAEKAAADAAAAVRRIQDANAPPLVPPPMEPR
jgi:hypothetical protein